MVNKVKTWVQEHPKAVLITATAFAIVTGAGAALFFKNKSVNRTECRFAEKIEANTTAITDVINATVETAKETNAPTLQGLEAADGVFKSFNRKRFVRTLHEGWHPSDEKIAQAAMLGIVLRDNETLVNPCVVTRQVA